MNVKLVKEKSQIDGEQIQQLLAKCVMGTYSPELHQKAFQNSYRIVLLYQENIQHN